MDWKMLSWENGFELIMKSNFDALEEPCPNTNLFPFMLAALRSDFEDVNEIYLLLRENVNILNYINRKKYDCDPI